MVNDTIANALDTIQCRVVSYDSEWTTGNSLPVNSVDEEENIFPIQKYDWKMIRKRSCVVYERIELVRWHYC